MNRSSLVIDIGSLPYNDVNAQLTVAVTKERSSAYVSTSGHGLASDDALLTQSEGENGKRAKRNKMKNSKLMALDEPCEKFCSTFYYVNLHVFFFECTCGGFSKVHCFKDLVYYAGDFEECI